MQYLFFSLTIHTILAWHTAYTVQGIRFDCMIPISFLAVPVSLYADMHAFVRSKPTHGFALHNGIGLLVTAIPNSSITMRYMASKFSAHRALATFLKVIAYKYGYSLAVIGIIVAGMYLYRQRYRGTAIRQNKNQTPSHIIPWLLACGGAGDMGMKRKKLLIGFCSALGLLPTDILAAGTAAPTPPQLPLVQENKATLSGTIHTQSFLYNTEYFNKILEGETLFGFHILPSLSLLFANRIAIQPGLIWQHHFGQPNPWAGFRPACSTSYHAPNFKLVLGIFGLQEQPLHFIEPLFDPTRPMVRPFIEGLHFKLAGPRGYVMGWVDWLSLLSRKQNQPERFTVHLATAYRFPHPEGSSCYTVPLQGGIYHVGGQGIAVKDFSLFCGATGILCSFMQPMRFLKRLDCAGYFLCNTYAKQIDRPFKKGWGQFYCMDWVLPTGGITIRYWYGAGFSSENIGNPLYQSVRIIDHKVVHVEATRSLLFATGYKYWDPLAHLRIQCSLCPYIDLKNRLVEFSCSLDLTYTLRFAWTDIQNAPPDHFQSRDLICLTTKHPSRDTISYSPLTLENNQPHQR